MTNLALGAAGSSANSYKIGRYGADSGANPWHPKLTYRGDSVSNRLAEGSRCACVDSSAEGV